MNLFKKLFFKKKPLIYTSLEADRRYKEDDPYPPWQNDLDNSIDWGVDEKKKVKKKWLILNFR